MRRFPLRPEIVSCLDRTLGLCLLLLLLLVVKPYRVSSLFLVPSCVALRRFRSCFSRLQPWIFLSLHVGLCLALRCLSLFVGVPFRR